MAVRGGRALAVSLAVLLLTTSAQAVQIIAGTPSTFTTIYSQQHLVVALHEKGSIARPVGFKIQPGSAARPMTDKDGKEWTCYLPPKQPAHEEHKQLSTTPPEDLIPQEVKTPFELLERMSTLCLYRQEGLWTYEMCYKKQTRQFRQGTNEYKGEEFSCGSYTGDENQVEEVKVDHASPADARLRYVSHQFTGGAPCVLTGSGRTTEVRFTCQKDVKDNVIVSVREFPTCNYVFTVSTPFLCKHPQFKPPDEMHRTINCLPAQRTDKEGTHHHTREQTHTHEQHGQTDLTQHETAGGKEAGGEAASTDKPEAVTEAVTEAGTDTLAAEATPPADTPKDESRVEPTQEQAKSEESDGGVSAEEMQRAHDVWAQYKLQDAAGIGWDSSGGSGQQAVQEEVHGHVSADAMQRARDAVQALRQQNPELLQAAGGGSSGGRLAHETTADTSGPQGMQEEVHGDVSADAMQRARDAVQALRMQSQELSQQAAGGVRLTYETAEDSSGTHGDVSEEALQRAHAAAHEAAVLMADQRAAAAHQEAVQEAADSATVVQELSINCDLRPEGDQATPTCSIQGMTPEQSRIVQEQVAAGTHTEGQSSEYMAVYTQHRDEAYRQVLEQVLAQGMSEAHAQAHALHQATVHAHASALAHVHALEGLVPQQEPQTVHQPATAENAQSTHDPQSSHAGQATQETTQPEAAAEQHTQTIQQDAQPEQHPPAAGHVQHPEPTEGEGLDGDANQEKGLEGDATNWDEDSPSEIEHEDFTPDFGAEPDFSRVDEDEDEDDNEHEPFAPKDEL